MNPRNLGNGEKNQPSNGQRLTGGANYHGGMTNYAARTVDRSLSTLNMENTGSHRGSEQSGRECEMGFADFTPTQVDYLFSLFKEKQNQEKMDKLSGKSLHSTLM